MFAVPDLGLVGYDQIYTIKDNTIILKTTVPIIEISFRMHLSGVTTLVYEIKHCTIRLSVMAKTIVQENKTKCTSTFY